MNIEELKTFSDHIKPMTCIISVEKFPDGSYGNIRIVTGNSAYLHATEEYMKVGRTDLYDEEKFVPDQPYERYVLKDLNFEDYCYRSAILGETLHSYVRPEKYNFWIHFNMVPLISDKENIGYCTYTQEFTSEVEAGVVNSLSPDIMSRVLNTCISLRSSDDFETAAQQVVNDISELTNAEHSCILLTDFEQRHCRVLCETLGKDTKLLSMQTYVNDDFIDIAATWDDTIAGSTCIIINEQSDWDTLKERNPIWYDSMRNAGAKSLVLFPLRSHGKSLGYIWAINFDTANTVKIKETLELTSFFVASEVSNYLMFNKLTEMSTIDMLTGVSNRNALNERIGNIKKGGEGSGNTTVIFADINELKQVNDSKGHIAGDLLLKKAALALQDIFPDETVYRAGGDEFVIITSKLSDEEINARLDMLAK
ncbi:MAG: diguanylate cyclase, partial [Ruminococcus sp.]|nr:diguanylate cyclase [Ruminococcus sp.]